ncbi:MAG: hypothetical protein RMJ56_04175 [Gemmataceae bacterium]|nr:hypothetical protein [Gemmata sp.]MDW8196786.1 hypothetical protein [Gemmataceae bacterium]
MEIEWTDEDPATGNKRFVRACKFARRWHFSIRWARRTPWQDAPEVTRAMWETLLDALERRYWRREGVSDDDLQQVRRILAVFRPPPSVDTAEPLANPASAGPETPPHHGHPRTE